MTRSAVVNIQEATIQHAVNRGAPWTESEDAYLATNLHHEPRELGRTYYAVESRMKRIRKKQG